MTVGETAILSKVCFLEKLSPLPQNACGIMGGHSGTVITHLPPTHSAHKTTRWDMTYTVWKETLKPK